MSVHQEASQIEHRSPHARAFPVNESYSTIGRRDGVTGMAIPMDQCHGQIEVESLPQIVADTRCIWRMKLIMPPDMACSSTKHPTTGGAFEIKAE